MVCMRVPPSSNPGPSEGAQGRQAGREGAPTEDGRRCAPILPLKKVTKYTFATVNQLFENNPFWAGMAPSFPLRLHQHTRLCSSATAVQFKPREPRARERAAAEGKAAGIALSLIGCMEAVWRLHGDCMETVWRLYGDCMVVLKVPSTLF